MGHKNTATTSALFSFPPPPSLSQITASGEAKCRVMKTLRLSCWTGPLRGTEASCHDHPASVRPQIGYSLRRICIYVLCIHDTEQNLQTRSQFLTHRSFGK